MKRPMRMHHVGIVVATVEKAYEFINQFGLEVDYTGYVKAYKADLIFTKYNEHESPLEFIIPSSDSVLANFNEGRGGIAHIAFEVDDVEAVSKDFEALGYGMLEKEPVVGTDDIIVNFLRPKFSNGILVEFVETVGPIVRQNVSKVGKEAV